MDEEVYTNKKVLNILNVCDYNITYFQCYLSVLHGALRLCLVRREMHRHGRKTVQTYDTYIYERSEYIIEFEKVYFNFLRS
jgi:hypothetical protein